MAALPQLLVFILLYIVKSEFGECVQVFVGEPVTFPGTANCMSDKPAELSRIRQHGTQPVAERKQGVWIPAEGYKDRVNQNTSFAFNRTVYTDTGLYQLICDGREEDIQLDVLVGFAASVTEGDPVNLPCYYITTDTHVESLQWRKEGEVVLELNLATGETKYGPGYEGRVSLSPDGYKRGEWSLIWDQAQLEDGGDYFCSLHSKGARQAWGDPAAVRLKVTKRSPVQTTLRPPRTPTQNVTGEEMETWKVVAITAIAVVAFLLLGYFLISRFCSGCQQYFPVHNGQHNGAQHHQTNGGPPQASVEVESMV